MFLPKLARKGWAGGGNIAFTRQPQPLASLVMQGLAFFGPHRANLLGSGTGSGPWIHLMIEVGTCTSAKQAQDESKRKSHDRAS